MGSLWNSLVDGMGAILAFLYSVVPNYGFAIIGLTVLVRLALFPLTAKQARSMQKMQHIQPELKKLQAQYKNDRQKLNEEIMKFYKENQVNPMAGCLPLVLQMPVFFALFQVLSHPHKRTPLDSKLYEAFCGDLSRSACGARPGGPEGLSFLGMDLGKAASQLSGSFTDALPYFLLIALVVVTGYLQFKQTQSRQTAQANPQMAIMGRIFPVMFAFVSYSLPSGVVLYFLVSNAWQIGQQALIFRTMPAPPQPGDGGTVAATGSAPRATGKPDSGKPKAQTPAAEPPQEGGFKRALREGRERAGGGSEPTGNGDGQSKPAPKRPPSAGGGARSGGDGGLGRAQPSGSQPRPKKRRR
ncbi:MAG TPA: YidC/Oxa1 family membrane protein insertase [Acidimicrobiia bacterium]|nr:YidC/Oxa1 family membrane protein insertase [Acidimicrobiia bacterium]